MPPRGAGGRGEVAVARGVADAAGRGVTGALVRVTVALTVAVAEIVGLAATVGVEVEVGCAGGGVKVASAMTVGGAGRGVGVPAPHATTHIPKKAIEINR